MTFIGRRLAAVEKKEVSKAAAAQSQCHVKHYFIDLPAIARACSLTWVDRIAALPSTVGAVTQ
ncbi:hypothetical protein [Janthinobacterium sp. PAMC25594]|uniref:hypothetical protein n=1 Tax=Janthinobacterium sp. PAMC25594 TaxID=2861284 RepID=UPI001C633C66|nr:hypothetical protein [Janthinobacterium sp. PAMC25594]QYG08975.1 hypothetical protein KY494_09650 [Janthinobacterium sp. PAMC25594]